MLLFYRYLTENMYCTFHLSLTTLAISCLQAVYQVLFQLLHDSGIQVWSPEDGSHHQCRGLGMVNSGLWYIGSSLLSADSIALFKCFEINTSAYDS